LCAYVKFFISIVLKKKRGTGTVRKQKQYLGPYIPNVVRSYGRARKEYTIRVIGIAWLHILFILQWDWKLDHSRTMLVLSPSRALHRSCPSAVYSPYPIHTITSNEYLPGFAII